MSYEGKKKIILGAGALVMLVFCLAPFAWMVTVSLTGNPDFLLPGTDYAFSLKNYVTVLTSDSLHLLDYLRNSLVVSAVSALFAMVFAGLSAYAITRMSFPGRVAIPVILLGFSMFPQISIVGYLFRMMTGLGWINTYSALIFPYITLGLPLALWMMLSYFSRLPKDLDNAALIDGAGRITILFRVLLPLALPGALSTALLVFIYSFNEFLFALMLTIDFSARTVPVGIALFEGLHGQVPWGQIMAASVIATVPVLVLSAIFQRYIVQGLTEGAVKG